MSRDARRQLRTLFLNRVRTYCGIICLWAVYEGVFTLAHPGGHLYRLALLFPR